MLQDAIWRTLFIAEQAGIRAKHSHPINKDAARFRKHFHAVGSAVGKQVSVMRSGGTDDPDHACQSRVGVDAHVH